MRFYIRHPFRSLIFILPLLAAGCTDNSLSSGSQSAVALHIILPTGEMAESGFGLSKAATITVVTITVSASDMDDVTENLTISGGGSTASGTIEVPKGSARTFEIECFDGNGILQYSGSTTVDITDSKESVDLVTSGHRPAASVLSIDFWDSVQFDLSWTKNNDPDFASYVIVRAATAAALNPSVGPREIITTITSASTLSYTDATIVQNTLYYYAVIVWDTEGLGVRSGALGAYTPRYFFSTSGPWAIPDEDVTFVWFTDNSFAPSGATVIGVSYQIRIDDTGDPSTFWAGDYKIYLSSSTTATALTDVLVYNKLGARTDGDWDDDIDDDSDIWLNWRFTTAFNGESANQYWGVYVIDDFLGDSGQLENFGLEIYYQVGGAGKIGSLALSGTDLQFGSNQRLREDDELRLMKSSSGSATSFGSHGWTGPSFNKN